MEEKIKQSNPTLHKYLFTVTTFSKLLAMVLFIILPFVGFYLGMQYQQKVTVMPVVSEVKKIINLTSTLKISKALNGWVTYTSPRNDYSIDVPSTWTIQAPSDSADVVDVYMYASKIGYGPYVSIIKKTINTDIFTNVTRNLDADFIKKHVKVVDVQIGKYMVKEVTGLPGNGGDLDVYFPIDKNNYILVILSPYPDNPELANFQEMLSSFKLLN